MTVYLHTTVSCVWFLYFVVSSDMHAMNLASYQADNAPCAENPVYVEIAGQKIPSRSLW
jgi:hypothetical protein